MDITWLLYRTFAGIFASLFFLWLAFPKPAGSQEGISVEKNEVRLLLPDGLRFYLSARSQANIQKATLEYGTLDQSCQESTGQQSPAFDPVPHVDLTWFIDFKRSGVIPPGASLWWQWEIEDATGNAVKTEKETIVIRDQRHVWENLTGEEVTVQWYEGGQSWGRTLLTVAEQSLDKLEAEIGTRPEGPIWITVYPTAEELMEVLVTTYEWTGAVAFTQYGSILLSATPEEKDWVQETIRHEVAHLVIEQLTFNCQGVWVPTWLSEGLADRVSEEVSPEDIEGITQAIEKGELLPLKSLEGELPAHSEQAYLAYKQSALVVGYLIEQHGAQKMGELLAALQSGQLIDQSLTMIYGFDTSGLDAAWRASRGFSPPAESSTATAVAPTRTLIPTLALWTPIARPTATIQITQPQTAIAESLEIPISPTASAASPTAQTPSNTETGAIATQPKPDEQNKSFPWLIVILVAVAVLALVVIALNFFPKRLRR